MRYLVFVKFLPGGSLPPDEFFTRINAQWSWLEGADDAESKKASFEKKTHVRSAICIADRESIEQLAIDLAIMPGASISNVEVVPISEGTNYQHLVTDVSARRSEWQ
jgi:hypothetical protein